MTKFSEEGNIEGLGWVDAIKKFQTDLKVPTLDGVHLISKKIFLQKEFLFLMNFTCSFLLC